MTDLRPGSEIGEGIHWLKDKYVNNYIIESSQELILIDTALGKKANGILDYIRNELESRKVSKIYLTHHHLDHTGGLHRLYTTFHPQVFASEEDAVYIRGEKKAPMPNSLVFKPLFFIIMPFMRPKPITNVTLIKDKDIVDGMTVHHLPGHTLGSLGFMKSNVMFPGDAAVTGKQGQVKLGPKMVTESMHLAKSSFNKIGDLNFDLLLPGHGTPILEDASHRVLEAIEKLKE